jgi:hypothetical protein
LELLAIVYDGGDKPFDDDELIARLAAVPQRLPDLHFANVRKMDALLDRLLALPAAKSQRWLRLSMTDLTAAGAKRLLQFSALESVRLDGLKSGDDIVAAVLEHPGLRELQILDSVVAPAAFDHPRAKLRTLQLYGATEEHLARFARFGELESLDISLPQQMSDEALLKALPQWPKLRALFLQGAKITDASLAGIGRVSTLEQLSLQEVVISGKGLRELHGLKKLVDLGLRATKATPADIRELRAALPQCRIQHDFSDAETMPADPRKATN